MRLRGEGFLLRYNSKLPVVVYVTACGLWGPKQDEPLRSNLSISPASEASCHAETGQAQSNQRQRSWRRYLRFPRGLQGGRIHGYLARRDFDIVQTKVLVR